MPGPLQTDLLLTHHVTPTFVLDREGRVVLWNRACETLTGLKAEDVLGTREHWRGFYDTPRPCLADLVQRDRNEAVEELYVSLTDISTRRGAIWAENWCVMPITGRRLFLLIEAAPIFAADGKLLYVMETLRDISAMKETEVKLRTLAGRDALTGLANRRTFDDILASEWRRAKRANAPLSLLMVDVDHFKQFNDRLGHQRGDECLRAIAEVLAGEARRAGDISARYGGEEFAVLLPATDSAGAAHIAENLRAAVEQFGVDHPLSSAGPKVTVSIGTATVTPMADERVEKLICFADIALYRAKELSRNRVCAFHDGPSCTLARHEPTAGVEVPEIDSRDCAACRAAAQIV
jgi:diguanylate cyclase (GGDEF)-like protein/PAS domain S-box-containing protein